MKITCLQGNLSTALSVVGRAVATRTTLPITQNVKISTDDSRLKLAATNLEIGISTWMGGQIEEEGEITIPARLLTELVNSLPSDKIEIETTDQPIGISVTCARTTAQINGNDPVDFPPIPEVDSGLSGKIDAQVLNQAITHVAFAAATEDSRPVLTALYVELKGDDFTFAAADGFRLAVYNGKLLEPVAEDSSFLVPARSFNEVSRLIGSSSEPVEFTVTESKGQALFKLENIEVVTQLVEGTFPNYSQLIPESFDTRTVLDLNAFLSATRTASIFARDGSGIVKLEVTPGREEDENSGKLEIITSVEEVGENEGNIDAQVQGTESKIAFNSKYLADVLSVIQQEKVALETTSSSSPGVLRPVGLDEYIHVVMPMFVQW